MKKKIVDSSEKKKKKCKTDGWTRRRIYILGSETANRNTTVNLDSDIRTSWYFIAFLQL